MEVISQNLDSSLNQFIILRFVCYMGQISYIFSLMGSTPSCEPIDYKAIKHSQFAT